MDIKKHESEKLLELDNAKQEQCEIEKTCLKLSDLKDNVSVSVNYIMDNLMNL